MINIKEIKQISWRRLFAEKWIGKMLIVFILLCVMQEAASMLVKFLLGHEETIASDQTSQTMDMIDKSGGGEIAYVLVSLVFMLFVTLIFRSITAYGMASLSLKAARQDDQKWCRSSFAGLSRPLSLAWFAFVLGCKIFFWTLLFVIPGIIAIYRYSQAWYFKVEHPDWSVSKCLAESGEIMYGYKTKRLCLDLYFLGIGLLGALMVGVLVVLMAFLGAAADFMLSLLFIGVIFAVIAFMLWYELARAVFYEKLRQIPRTVDIAGSDTPVLGVRQNKTAL